LTGKRNATNASDGESSVTKLLIVVGDELLLHFIPFTTEVPKVAEVLGEVKFFSNLP
jgi:hypothetical protein